MIDHDFIKRMLDPDCNRPPETGRQPHEHYVIETLDAAATETIDGLIRKTADVFDCDIFQATIAVRNLCHEYVDLLFDGELESQ